MYQFIPNPHSLPHPEISEVADTFLSLGTILELADYLCIAALHLPLLAATPEYHHFQVQKSDGSLRQIEDPEPTLKALLHKLNEALQCVYYLHKTEAAYGFVMRAVQENDLRNLRTNAEKHLGQNYVLNLDIQDFFHAISQAKVAHIFSSPPFYFQEELAAILTMLTTYKGRLPMGSPTSPVLSNFAARELDAILLAWADQNKACFTRFADDMTLSSATPFSQIQIDEIRNSIQQQGFCINEDKFKLYHKDDPPLVTGLRLLEGKVDVTENYIEEIRLAFQFLQLLQSPNIADRNIFSPQIVQKFIQSLRGQIAFLGKIRGKEDDLYKKMLRRLKRM